MEEEFDPETVRKVLSREMKRRAAKRMQTMTPEQRKAVAKAGGKASWAGKSPGECSEIMRERAAKQWETKRLRRQARISSPSG